MAFAVSTQALAAKVALNGKTLNVRKSSVKAARNVTVRAAVSAPAVSNIPSSRRRPSFLPFARSWSPFPARIRVAREAEGVHAWSARTPLRGDSARARHRARRVSRIAASSSLPHPNLGKGSGTLIRGWIGPGITRALVKSVAVAPRNLPGGFVERFGSIARPDAPPAARSRPRRVGLSPDHERGENIHPSGTHAAIFF
jgi:hypothetical protein